MSGTLDATPARAQNAVDGQARAGDAAGRAGGSAGGAATAASSADQPRESLGPSTPGAAAGPPAAGVRGPNILATGFLSRQLDFRDCALRRADTGGRDLYV